MNQSGAQELQAWHDENPMAPREWLELARRLTAARELDSAWAQLRRQKIPVLQFFSLVTTAHESAISEGSRPKSKAEKAKLDRVARLAVELKQAIEDSPLRRQSAACTTLACDGLPEVPILLSMRDDLPSDGWGMNHYPLTVFWVLDRAVDLVNKHEAKLPPRAVARRGSRYEVVAFVRVLSFLLSGEFGKELHATVGVVASVLFDLDATEPLDKAAVQGILKDAPPAFRRPKERFSAA